MKRTVFISSTYTDLASYRRAIWSLLEQFNVTVMGMESFGARKEDPLQTCLAEVEQSDIYVGVIGFRIGSVHPDTGRSYTQMEYERAFELNREILIYLMDEVNARVTPSMVDRGLDAEKLDAFKTVLRDRHTVEFFVSEEDLITKLKRDFGRLLSSREPTAEEPDEFVATTALLEQFALAPKSVSGKQVRLRVARKGKLFPASKELCEAFNLEYGNAVGLAVEIIIPAGFTDVGLSEIYATGKRVADLIALAHGEILDVYASPMFSPKEVSEARARFKSESFTYVEASFFQAEDPFHSAGVRHVYHKAEGKVALLFTGHVSKDE